MSFAYDRDEYIAWEKEAKAPAIKPVVQLFEFARDHGMATIFLTSRHEDEREITVKDLESAGYQELDIARDAHARLTRACSRFQVG